MATGARPARSGMGVASICRWCVAENRSPGIHARKETQRVEAEMRLAKGLKLCPVCATEKPFLSFNASRATKDGRTNKCSECAKLYLAEYRRNNPEKFKEWYAANRDYNSQRYKEYRNKNPEFVAELFKRWASNNKEKVNALVAKRNARKLQAAVQWADQEKIRAIYKEAVRLTKETGVNHEVDHFYPLQGKTVCGLHWEANLQILTEVENIRKHNRMPEEISCAA